MAAKGPQKPAGGAGNKTAQSWVTKLWEEGKSEQEIRGTLKEYGYKAGRISQLIKATRPEVSVAAAAIEAPGGARALRRPVAASGVLRRPASASGPQDLPVVSGADTEDEAGRNCRGLDLFERVITTQGARQFETKPFF